MFQLSDNWTRVNVRLFRCRATIFTKEMFCNLVWSLQCGIFDVFWSFKNLHSKNIQVQTDECLAIVLFDPITQFKFKIFICQQDVVSFKFQLFSGKEMCVSHVTEDVYRSTFPILPYLWYSYFLALFVIASLQT